MITIDDQMKLTQEMSAVINDYALKVVIKDFLRSSLLDVSLYGISKFSSLLESIIGNTDPSIEGRPDEEIELMGHISKYMKALHKNDLYALRMYVLSERDEAIYEMYENEISLDNENDISWGRYKAELLYSGTVLNEMVYDMLKSNIVSFVSEFDMDFLVDISEENKQDKLIDFNEKLDSKIGFLKSGH